MLNSLDPDRHFVRPDLGPNCMQWLSADNTSRQRVSFNRIDKIKNLGKNVCSLRGSWCDASQEVPYHVSVVKSGIKLGGD